MKKTFYPKEEDISRKWVLVDAKGRNLGRLATEISQLILGKHKPEFTPGVDVGDFVVVINAEQIQVTGKKMDDKSAKWKKYSLGGGITMLSFFGIIDAAVSGLPLIGLAIVKAFIFTSIFLIYEGIEKGN